MADPTIGPVLLAHHLECAIWNLPSGMLESVDMEPPGVRCPHCPVDPGRPCEGLRFRRLCELADPDHAAYSPAYRPLLERLAGATPPAPAAARGRGAQATLGVDESVGLLRAMYACPHRTTRTDCGCAGLATCTLGHGRDGLVNHHDCFACLNGRRGVPPASPSAAAADPGSPASLPDRSLDQGVKRP